MNTQSPPPLYPNISTFRWSGAHPPADPTSTFFAGKTILITGATSGVGLEAAVKFAQLKASTLILGVRSLEKGNKVKDTIEQRTGCGPNVVHLLQLDMESHVSVKAFATQVLEKFALIHVVVLNAGVHPGVYRKTGDGWETALQVHAISTAQLAILLLPKLKETKRVIGEATRLNFVTSHGHLGFPLKRMQTTGSVLEKRNDPKNWEWVPSYWASKLIQMWFVDQIVSRTSSAEVIVNSSCPGFCKTGLSREMGRLIWIPYSVLEWKTARTQEEGARTLVSGSMLGPEDHGIFWSNDYKYEPGPLVRSEEAKVLSNKCWGELLEVLRTQDHGFDTSQLM